MNYFEFLEYWDFSLQGRVRKEVILKETPGEPVGQLRSPFRIRAQQGADGEEGNQHQLPSTGWSVSIWNVKRKETKCISWPCSLCLWRRISSLNLPGYYVQGMTTHLGIYSIANKGYYVVSLIMSCIQTVLQVYGRLLKKLWRWSDQSPNVWDHGRCLGMMWSSQTLWQLGKM